MVSRWPNSIRPSDLQAQLAATISFYASRSDQNVLFVQVADVITTNGSWWSGLAFDNVSQTGIDFSLPSNKSLGSPGFSDQYANPNEALFTGNYTETVPLSTTPGYILDVLGPNTDSVHTSNGAEYDSEPGDMLMVCIASRVAAFLNWCFLRT